MLNVRQKLNIILFQFLFGYGVCAYADFVDNSTIALEERIAPIGKIKVASSEIKPSSLMVVNRGTYLGKTIFESKCILCHKNGIAGAPRIGNQSDWAQRIKKKYSLLLRHVTTGYRAMPPKGACLECSIPDLEATINYMLEQLHSN
ncbi:MAG: c-type cytochrome [Candidatus Aquirickettsiella sp.]